ncbi:MAG: cupin domain-containing protein [Anaerolineae bacterium]|nr:cupin domain-containing protein [Anaerolineae bacterium]
MINETPSSCVLMREKTTPPVPGTPGVSRVFFTGEDIGSSHLSTGLTRFEPGAGLFWHLHLVDESVTLLEGQATLEIGGVDQPINSYQLQPLDTSFIPARTPHRFYNSGAGPMRILWSYPTGRIVRYRVNPDGSLPNDLAPGEPKLPAE